MGGHHDDGRTQHAHHARAERAVGVTGWVLALRRAPPRVRERTGSICAGVAFRRDGPCGASEPLGGLLETKEQL